MQTNQNTNTERDPELWELAKKRASFKGHLLTYIIMNIFFWGIWYFTKGNHSYEYSGHMRFPWPIWATFGWGIGLLFHYLGAYVFPKSNSVENEYQKLKNK